MKIVLATHNADKVREVGEILAGSGIEVIPQSALGVTEEAVEDGDTFEANARIKARAAMGATGLPAMADDSGLCVTALGGAPGVYSARFGGEALPYDRKCALLLEKLQGAATRRAFFMTAAVCVFPNGDELRTEGRIDGEIAFSPKGGNGFGYDPVFIPEGYDKTMAELSAAEKNAISHRGKAFRAMADALAAYRKEKDV